MKNHMQAEQGTGLIETLLIVLLVSISVVSFMNYQHYLSNSTNTSQQQFDANILATNEIESLRDFQVLSTTTGYSAYSSIASGSSTPTVGNTTYTVTWTVTANTNPNYKTIDVTVSWTDRFSGAQSVRMTSQVAGIDPGYASYIK